MDFDINPLLVLNVAFTLGIIVLIFGITAYLLALNDICFTRVAEGTAVRIMRGDAFDHCIMVWTGHRLNDPRRADFDSTQPSWEVLPLSDAHAKYSPYPAWKVHWRLLARYGIYWFGISPIKQVYVEEFDWTEPKIGDDGQPCPWHRHAPTRFIYVKPFSYWLQLKGAEDADNEPLNLDYLATVRCNNPYKATFKIASWLTRFIADANNRAKVYVGRHSFNEIKSESKAKKGMSGLTIIVSSINENLLTEPDKIGAPMSYGITVESVSLVNVTPAGTVAGEVESALVAKRVAELNGQAIVATAEAEANATRARAAGTADAIKRKYESVKEFGDLGTAMYQMDTINEAANKSSTTIIWANDPLGGMKDWFGGAKPANTN